MPKCCRICWWALEWGCTTENTKEPGVRAAFAAQSVFASATALRWALLINYGSCCSPRQQICLQHICPATTSATAALPAPGPLEASHPGDPSPADFDSALLGLLLLLGVTSQQGGHEDTVTATRPGRARSWAEPIPTRDGAGKS